MSGTTVPDAPDLACDLAALSDADREPHRALVRRLFGEAVQERQELPDGYAFRFAVDEYADVASFVGNERLCCPFFTFELQVTAGRGPLWLRIAGGEGVKELVEATFVR